MKAFVLPQNIVKPTAARRVLSSNVVRPLNPLTRPTLYVTKDALLRGSVVVSAKSKAKKEEATYNDIKVSEERKGNRVTVTVEVPPEVTKAAYKATMEVIRTSSRIEGFRKGAPIPENILVTHMGGLKQVHKFVCEEIMAKTMPIALKPYQEKALEGSEVVETRIEDFIDNFTMDKAMQYAVSVETEPELKFTRDPATIAVTITAAGDAAVAKARAEARIRSFLKSQGTLTVVSERTALPSDILIIDFDCVRKSDGAPLAGARRKGWQFDLEAGADFVPGLAEGLVGVKVGDERNIEVRFPDNWNAGNNLRGIEAICQVKVNELFQWTLPAESDELARKADPRAASFAALREIFVQDELVLLEEENNNRARDAIARELLGLLDVEVPKTFLEAFAATEYQGELMGMVERGVINPAMLPNLTTPDLLTKFIKERREELEEGCKLSMAAEALYIAKGLSINAADVEEEVKAAKLDFLARGEKFTEDNEKAAREQAEQSLKGAATFQWLQENCKVTVLPYTA